MPDNAESVIRVGDRRFILERASDSIRGGMALLCEDVTTGGYTMVLEAFYWDKDGTFTLTAYQDNLPMELVQIVIHAAREALPPSRK